MPWQLDHSEIYSYTIPLLPKWDSTNQKSKCSTLVKVSITLDETSEQSKEVIYDPIRQGNFIRPVSLKVQSNHANATHNVYKDPYCSVC